jgi:hypothetical protein
LIKAKSRQNQGKIDGKLEVARNRLTDGMSPDAIAKNTKLSLDQIQGLMN